MKRIGLTGNIGSGKTTVARIFETLGVPVFYSDETARSLYLRKDVKEKLMFMFPGVCFYNPEGRFQKAMLANLVFSDPAALAKINHLIHPLVEEEFNAWVRAFQHRTYVVQESAILFENELAHRFQSIIHVSASEEVRLQRILLRDQLDAPKVKARMKNQMPDSEKRKLADYVIENDGDEMLIPQVFALHRIFNTE